MTDNAVPRRDKPEPVPGSDSYPGLRYGLPREGPGALASWQIRITALVVDWAVSTGIAFLLFGSEAIRGTGWQMWMVMAVFFVESSVLSALFSGSAGQLATRIAVVRLDRQPLGIVRALLRAALVCTVIPALVVGADRRGLHDVAVNTMVIRRR